MASPRNIMAEMDSPPAPQEAPNHSNRANKPDDKVVGDGELVRRLNQGDESAYRELLERHGRYLFGIAHSLSGNSEDAQDLVQETFVGALSSNFRGEAAVRTWLVQILVRRAAMLRRNKARGGGTSDISAATADPRMASPSATGGADARIDLDTMLRGLSPEHRDVIVLRELQGMSYEEMATALGVPLGTIESRLYRARAELRKRFKDYL
jgi:RNA polymerase sigma-70 factor (ECF subfamily)